MMKELFTFPTEELQKENTVYVTLAMELHATTLTNDKDRIQFENLLSEARKKLNSHLSIEKINLALIPKDGQTEKLCYEFTGKHKDHRFIIYLNAETGQEEEILMLIEDENGVLTM